MEDQRLIDSRNSSSSSSGVAFITGVTGQDGSYLAELLLSKGYEVHGLKRRASSYNTGRIDHLYDHEHESNSRLHLHYGDLTDSSNLAKLIKVIKPTELYNLAAQSHVQVSFETPEYTANADGLGALRLLEGIRLSGLENVTRYYQASTSEMFGLSNGNSLNEHSSFHPRSPYGVSKLFAHWITINYREAYGIFACNGILFNHESPRRGETFVTRKIIRRAVEIANNKSQVLYLGNLDAVRDWGHAKDYVEGMWKILSHHRPEDWVLATGHAISVRRFAEIVFQELDFQISWVGTGLDERGIDQNGITRIAIDSRHFRPAEVPHLLGNADKARRMLDWTPKYTLEKLIKEMLDQEIKAQQ